MPFKYGIATMTEVPMVFVRIEAEIDGTKTAGIASDLLPPKWFTKVPEDPLEKEISDMLQVIRKALSQALGQAADSAFDLWKLIYDGQSRWAEANNIPALLAHFGTSLVERALIEATGKAVNKTLGQALLSGSLGFEPGHIHACLEGQSASSLLPKTPLAKVQARHTVGLGDPLDSNQIDADDRIDDTLPQSLDQCIQAYGLRHFKIKINGDIEWDLDRLKNVAKCIEQHADSDFAFSLDGNEQFQSVTAFRDHWNILHAEPELETFFDHLLFIEQPLHRDVALNGSLKSEFDQWPDRPAVIIDESDATIESLPQALAIGYAGTSHKNCKGIFKGIANACLLEHHRRNGNQTVMSGEDLCNVGPVAVIQDLAVMATLGIESVERNGHHYMAGLSQFPERTREQVLNAHDGLYKTSETGWPTLAICNGEIDLTSVNTQAFGTGFELDLSVFSEIPLTEG
ncbi:MAG: hypothetical protein ACPHL9_04370 [Limisphaerales bacterium]